MIMILGDMNARVGRAKDSWPGIIGGYGSPTGPPPTHSPAAPSPASTQAFWCMMAYFSIFWWYGVGINQLLNSINNNFWYDQYSDTDSNYDFTAQDGT